MSYFQLGRLILGPPWQWYEAVGDPVTNLGGAAIPAPRQALRHQISISTLAADGYSDTLADRLRIRRQLRSMLNNTPLKLQGYFYIIYSDDPEQNGWFVPDFGQMQDIEGAVGLATGTWKLDQVAWILVGHKRTNREARNIWMKDLRLGVSYRDTLRAIYSTDFSTLPALSLSYFPHGAASLSNAVSGMRFPSASMPAGRDGGICQQVVGLVDLACVGYDRPDSAWSLSDVIVYDRRGAGDAPSAGPGSTWEEIYGPDYPYAWSAATPGGADAPVLDNGLVRVRYDGAIGNPGFRVDVWNGSAYVEQGKATFIRVGSSRVALDTWISASVYSDNSATCTPDRATIKVVLASSTDPYSRENIFVTVQRGEIGLTIEAYASVKSNNAPADIEIDWSLVPGDSNDSVIKLDSQTQPPTVGSGKIVATAGTGSAIFGLATIGATSFANSENYVACLRCIGGVAAVSPYQTNISVVQTVEEAFTFGSSTAGYGSLTSMLEFVPNTTGQGYNQVQIGFAATVAQQIMEAESMTLGTGTSNTVDAAASNGHAATATRTSDANLHVSQALWPNSFTGVFRIFARIKSTNTFNIYAKNGTTTTTTVIASGGSTPVYQWYDLGEVVADTTTLEIHTWLSGAGTVSVDRLEAFLVQDRTRGNAIYSGARDMGQSALMDSRVLGAVIAR